MEFVTLVYLIFMFIALYFFSFFIILTIKNRNTLFSYPKPKKSYTVSVLIPAHNEEKNIAETIEYVANSNYPKDLLEIIVINDGSTDGTAREVEKLKRRYKNLVLINKNNSGKADSLNIAVKRAKGELIAVVDSDSFPEKDSLLRLTGYFNDEKMAAVTSFVTIRNKDSNFFARIQSLEYLILAWSRKLLDYVDSVYVTNGPLSLYRKSYMLKVGGFDTKTVTEDIDITWNMLYHNYKTAMCLDARVSTITPIKFKAWYRQRTRWGLGGLQALAKYKQLLFRKGMFGMFVLPYVSFSIILSLFTFIFSIYLVSKFILARLLTIGYSISTDSAVFSLQDINLYPSVIIFFFAVLFTLSIGYSIYILKSLKYEQKLDIRKVFILLFYILAYLTMYPLVWFSSIKRYIADDRSWD